MGPAHRKATIPSGMRLPPIGGVDLLAFFQGAERPFGGRVRFQLRESHRIVRAPSEVNLGYAQL